MATTEPTSTDGPEKWVPEAIAQQEEHVKRSKSCTGINGSHPGVGLSHSWDLYSTAPGGPKYEACWRCRVTKTDADYQTRLAARATRMEGA